MELSDIPGIGSAKANRLREAGVETVQDLAELDLRRSLDIGIGDEILKRGKAEARRLLRQAGIPYRTASYRRTSPAARNSPAQAAPAPQRTDAPTNGTDAAASPRGLLARIFRRTP